MNGESVWGNAQSSACMTSWECQIPGKALNTHVGYYISTDKYMVLYK